MNQTLENQIGGAFVRLLAHLYIPYLRFRRLRGRRRAGGLILEINMRGGALLVNKRGKGADEVREESGL